MKEAIYPEISVNKRGDGWTLSTVLRKQHEGVWYLWRHLRVCYSADLLYKARFLEILHNDVYHSLILGKVDPTLLAYDNEQLFIKDPDQRSEEDRLLDKLLTAQKKAPQP